MKPFAFSLLMFALAWGCVAVDDADREAYDRLTDERLDRFDEKIARWSEARERQDLVLEEVLKRELRRESARLADGLKLGLASGEASKRATCAAALGFSEDESAVSPLVELLKDPEADVRACAMLGLCLLDSRRTPVDPVMEGLQDSDPLVRRLAVLCLADLYDPAERRDVFEIFVAALKDADPGVRINASSALGRIGEARAAGPLAETALADEVGLVRKNAAVGLARLGDPETVEPLLAALELELSSSVKKEIIRALEKMTGLKAGENAQDWREAIVAAQRAPGSGEEGTGKKAPSGR